MTSSRESKRALAALVASATLFGAMAALVKVLAARLPAAEIAVARFAVGSLPLLLLPAARREAFTTSRLDLLFYRGFFGAVAVVLWFLAIERIPVGTATLLTYTAPVFSVFFAAVFLRERPPRGYGLPLAVALVGVALVVGPRTSGVPAGWAAVGLLSAVCSGAAVAAVRAARRTESAWSVFAAFTLFGLIVSVPVALTGRVMPRGSEWGLLLLVGLLSLAAQLLMTWAYRWVDNLRAGILAQLAPIVATGLGIGFLGDPLTISRSAGTLLTLGGIAGVLVRSATRGPETPGTPPA